MSRAARRFAADLGTLDEAVGWLRGCAPPWVPDDAIDFGFTEALTNAIVHGSMGPGARERLLEAAPEPCDERVDVEASWNERRFTVALRWHRHACPEEHRRAALPDDVEAVRGRGLAIIGQTFDRVRWDASGLSFELELDAPGDDLPK